MGNLADRILEGNVRAAARLMRLLDDELPEAVEELKALYPHTGRAFILGITGSPGAGKSTLTDQVIRAYRERGKTVGVVAIDPTSPFSGGAILGDRIRMQNHEGDPGVFVRSLATRGNLGGLSRSTRDVVHVMDAMGKDVVIIETVGVGQDEVDVVGTAHTSVVVVVPGMGDDIQAIKAGILEIADVFVLNKADREGADRTEREIRMMLELGNVTAARGWKPPVVRTIATTGDGMPDMLGAIDEHHGWAAAEGRIAERQRQFAVATFWETVELRLKRLIQARLDAGPMAGLRRELEDGTTDPYTAAETVLADITSKLTTGS